MFTIKLHKNILCIFVHDISQYLMKCCTSMSDITQLIFSLHHYLTAQASPAAPGQGALPSPSQNSQCLLAALLAMPALASSSARTSLIIAHSCFALLSGMPGASFHWIFDHRVTTKLYFASTSRENPRYYALLALFAGFALGRKRWLQTDD